MNESPIPGSPLASPSHLDPLKEHTRLRSSVASLLEARRKASLKSSERATRRSFCAQEANEGGAELSMNYSRRETRKANEKDRTNGAAGVLMPAEDNRCRRVRPSGEARAAGERCSGPSGKADEIIPENCPSGQWRHHRPIAGSAVSWPTHFGEREKDWCALREDGTDALMPARAPLLGIGGSWGEALRLQPLSDEGLNFEGTPLNGPEFGSIFGAYRRTEKKKLSVPQDHCQGVVDFRDDMSEQISGVPALFAFHTCSRFTPSGSTGWWPREDLDRQSWMVFPSEKVWPQP